MILRLLKNMISNQILLPHELKECQVLERILPLMTTKLRLDLIASIISVLCTFTYFKEQVAQHKEACLGALLQIITEDRLSISDQCLSNVLAAIA